MRLTVASLTPIAEAIATALPPDSNARKTAVTPFLAVSAGAGNDGAMSDPIYRIAQESPINLGVEVFAPYGAVRESLDSRAILSRDTPSLLPRLNVLIAFEPKGAGHGRFSSKDVQTALKGVDEGGIDCCFHNSTHLTLENLVNEEKLALAPEFLADKFVGMTIHQRIHRARVAKNLSQQQLAEAVGYKSYQTVQQWENGKTAPKRTKLEAVARVLGVTPDYLASGSRAPVQPGRKLDPKSVEDPYARIEAGLADLSIVGRDKAMLLEQIRERAAQAAAINEAFMERMKGE